MPKGETSRSMSVEQRKRNRALHETIADVSKNTDANIGDLDRKIREQNVRMIDLDSATRAIMKNAGPGAKRKGVITKSMLSQRTPGGSH